MTLIKKPDSPEEWICDTCGTHYAEYVNGCPHCETVGIRSRVESLPPNKAEGDLR